MSSTKSIWFDTIVAPTRLAITNDATVDVCVIGAGIAGLSVAYTCARNGKSVVVLDLDQIGCGESGRTTAHLATELDDRYARLESARGEEVSRMAYEAHAAAVDRIEQTIRDERIDCDFTRLDAYLFLGGDDTEQLLDDELAAARRAGCTDAEKVPQVPGFASGPALRFPRQGRFHILKYLSGLAEAIERHGGQIYGDSKVESIEGGAPATVTTSTGITITATDVVVCTNGSISDMVITHTKQAPYRTFVIAHAVERGAVPDALYWDTPDPYHYVRIQPLEDGRDAVLIGGEDHKTAHADDAGTRFATLESWARGKWPQLGERITQWSGQCLEPIDYLMFCGRNPDGAEHVWMASGDSGMGMTHGTIAGMLLPALMEGKTHRWASVFDPRRFIAHAAELETFAKENIDVAMQFRDYVTPGQVGDVADIPRGEGRVIRRGLHKVAAYKDDTGKVHECSAVCTHVKCIVDWNTAEKSWDCPCHGSRFDPYGKVLNGPAITDLEKL
jgi:glycine/D-amino acid oxidase-like deaminating enzyme/nitrite reductase/ring-hydroxylating ferredoxin subunit